MPKAFLDLVAKNLLSTHSSGMSDVCVVLPSRRAGLFLKRILAAQCEAPVIAPQIIVIEKLATELSGLFAVDSLSSQFILYSAYSKVMGSKAEPFESFIKWSSRLLQDFNEIDRYLINAKEIFTNVADAKALERWGVEGEPPEIIEAYMLFWTTLYPIYMEYRAALLERECGYQGMQYRRAAERVSTEGKLESWCEENGVKHLYFVGFNALNEAEKVIFQRGLDQGYAHAWFDADTFYLDDHQHEAGMFLREYRRWKHFDQKEFSFVRDLLRGEQRTIEIIGVPRQIGMAKTLSSLLSEMRMELNEGEVTDHMALVLADEGMLLPVLNSLPSEFDEINVTMGLPLRELNLANSVEVLFECHERALRLQKNEGRSFQIYHKDLERLLLQPLFQHALGDVNPHVVLESIRKYNAPFLRPSKLEEWLGETALMPLLREQLPEEILERLAKLLAQYHDGAQVLPEDLEAAQHLYRVTLRLRELFEEFELQTDMTTALHLYRQLLREDSLDFFGEPLRGLQLMGVLETRLLSFDHLVMTSVNEDVLPAGRSENSFIPYDIKRAFGLPTHREKDAIYAYHFYRLLQGTKHAVLLYNTESDGMNSGEASRFIEQIRHEFDSFSGTTIIEKVFSTSVCEDQLAQPFQLERGAYLDEAFKARAEKGIAPSHLKLWVENPVDFYLKVILGQQELDEVEEVLGDRSMGNVVHKVLENFYRGYIGRCPSDEDYAQVIRDASSLLYTEYKEQVGRELEAEGRNNLVAHAMVQMTVTFLREERKRAAQYKAEGRVWVIRGVEVEMSQVLNLPGVDYPVKVKGFADRLDTLDGVWCVIDYKTGTASASELKVDEISALVEEPSRAKALQLMTYAWLVSSLHSDVAAVEAGIFALRKNGEGLLKLAVEKKRTEIVSADFQTFEADLSSLLCDIFTNRGVIAPNDVLADDE